MSTTQRPFRVAVVDTRFPNLDLEEEVLGSIATLLDLQAREREVVLRECNVADAILIGPQFRVDRAAFEVLPKCKVIARYGVGYDNIDLDAARRAGVTVTYVPDYCVEEVADHAIAMLLVMNRRVLEFDQRVRTGGWSTAADVTTRRLSECTLGVIGLGRIGGRVAQIGLALGMTVIASDPARIDADAKALGVSLVSQDEVLERADYLSLHAPGNAVILDSAAIRRLKPGAALINVSRGSLIDEQALTAALSDGHVSAAALDVQRVEPPLRDAPLLRAPNVVFTPHVAWMSTSAARDLRVKASQEVLRVLTGRAVVNVAE